MLNPADFNARAAWVLSRAHSASEALNALLRLRSPSEKPGSIATIARYSGFGSRANLHNVIAGRRALTPPGAAKLGAYFKLDEINRSLLVALAELDSRSGAPQKKSAEARIAKLKRLLRQNAYRLDPKVRADDYLFFMVLKAAFDLFPEGPSREDLVALFGTETRAKLGRALDWGQKAGLIRLARGRYHYRFRFGCADPTSPQKVKQVLKEAVLQALRAVDQHDFERRDSYFRATLVSTSRERLEEQLAKFALRVREFESSLDGERPEEVVQIGIQIFPALVKK